LDRAARWGVPAHVTVIYPFLAPHRLGADVLRRLGDTVASVPRFDVAFSEVRWFSDTTVWLAPDPPASVQALIDAVWSEFPECPPYGGAFATSVPHLTIGHGADLAAMSTAADAISARLPVPASVSMCSEGRTFAAGGKAWPSSLSAEVVPRSQPEGRVATDRARAGGGVREPNAALTRDAAERSTYLYGRRMDETMAVWETGPAAAGQSPQSASFAATWQAADKVVISSRSGGLSQADRSPAAPSRR
jgi:2'-5' RNA ligase superfamily